MTERTPLLTQSSQGGIEVELEAMSVDHVENEEEDDNDNDGIRMNLNMCSAWTVSQFIHVPLHAFFPSLISYLLN